MNVVTFGVLEETLPFQGPSKEPSRAVLAQENGSSYFYLCVECVCVCVCVSYPASYMGQHSF